MKDSEIQEVIDYLSESPSALAFVMTGGILGPLKNSYSQKAFSATMEVLDLGEKTDITLEQAGVISEQSKFSQSNHVGVLGTKVASKIIPTTASHKLSFFQSEAAGFVKTVATDAIGSDAVSHISAVGSSIGEIASVGVEFLSDITLFELKNILFATYFMYKFFTEVNKLTKNELYLDQWLNTKDDYYDFSKLMENIPPAISNNIHKVIFGTETAPLRFPFLHMNENVLNKKSGDKLVRLTKKDAYELAERYKKEKASLGKKNSKLIESKKRKLSITSLKSQEKIEVVPKKIIIDDFLESLNSLDKVSFKTPEISLARISILISCLDNKDIEQIELLKELHKKMSLLYSKAISIKLEKGLAEKLIPATKHIVSSIAASAYLYRANDKESEHQKRTKILYGVAGTILILSQVPFPGSGILASIIVASTLRVIHKSILYYDRHQSKSRMALKDALSNIEIRDLDDADLSPHNVLMSAMKEYEQLISVYREYARKIKDKDPKNYKRINARINEFDEMKVRIGYEWVENHDDLETALRYFKLCDCVINLETGLMAELLPPQRKVEAQDKPSILHIEPVGISHKIIKKYQGKSGLKGELFKKLETVLEDINSLESVRKMSQYRGFLDDPDNRKYNGRKEVSDNIIREFYHGKFLTVNKKKKRKKKSNKSLKTKRNLYVELYNETCRLLKERRANYLFSYQSRSKLGRRATMYEQAEEGALIQSARYLSAINFHGLRGPEGKMAILHLFRDEIERAQTMGELQKFKYQLRNQHSTVSKLYEVLVTPQSPTGKLRRAIDQRYDMALQLTDSTKALQKMIFARQLQLTKMSVKDREYIDTVIEKINQTEDIESLQALLVKTMVYCQQSKTIAYNTGEMLFTYFEAAVSPTPRRISSPQTFRVGSAPY